MTDTPRAAVIIPHYNDTVRLQRCISAMINEAEPGSLDGVEILVCDNGSTEDVAAVLAPWPQIRLLVEPRKGAAHARNLGVAESTAPLLWFIDADCLPGPGWLARAAEVCDRADIVGGAVPVFDETPPPRSGAEAFEAVFAFNMRDYIECQGFAGAGNTLTTRAVFERTGPFIHGVPEDKDWSRRAVTKGASMVYAAELIASHPSRSDWTALRRKWRRLTDEAWGERDRTLAARLTWVGRALAVALSGTAHLPRVLFSDRLEGAGERFHGGVTLLRLRFLRCGWMLGQALKAASPPQGRQVI
ncbi:glycosyltransferase family 2 protein [Pseudooceanicola onchidii]|uniref:glycosyltransferase family 2 protein n=1 Tax=Pseudooceanicola onchidii TaxID=2562279 RepID=UPI0010AAF9CF|nr:glycosyltransferase family 2 protein [Pseudooceanicola onchidii]